MLGAVIRGEGVPDDPERTVNGLVGDAGKHPHDVVGVLLPGGEMSLQFQVGEGELGVAVEQDAAVHE